MTEKQQIVFGGGSIAKRYDDVLVPILFDPWAELLIETQPPESGWDILDLATGTGIVASKLAERLGEAGSLTAADISSDMLALAKSRLAGVASKASANVSETAAAPLQLNDDSFDAIYCQQGFQFFPDADAAAAEMHRVLRPGGRVAIAAWCPLSECEFFGAMADCMREIGEEEAAGLIGLPFDHMPRAALESHFSKAGFRDLRIDRLVNDMSFDRGPEHAYEVVSATPLAPKLNELSDAKSAEFRSRFLAKFEARTKGGVTTAQLASLILTATA